MNDPTQRLSAALVLFFAANMTVRWPCLAGDFILSIPCPDPLSGGNGFAIADMWEARDGDIVTITNRLADFPIWFRLAPQEVSGRAAYEMTEKLNRREIKPTDPMEAANVWKVPAGARLAWVGKERPGYKFNHGHGVLQLLDFQENALVVGESASLDWETFTQFGALTKASPSAADQEMFSSARRLSGLLGMPRTVSLDWTIG